MDNVIVQVGSHVRGMLWDWYPKRLDSLDMEIVSAARTSYAGDMKGPDKDLRLLEYLRSHRHDSPLEMVDLSFMVDAPLVVWWQWVRHRTFSYNFQSGRYTEFEQVKTLIPNGDEWRLQDDKNKQGSDGFLPAEDGQWFTSDLADLYADCFHLYEKMLDAGIAREQARLCLPGFAVYYRARVKANLRNWLHWLSLRNEGHAQQEIREFAQVIEDIISQTAPYTLRYYKQHRMQK